mmetsp:Transcript_8314/g.14613  ORF Transcript_8314/g.14613 Transcript_8314/m.14613 type:complete len:323 (+) Transcript_8314:39-1007(+)
MVSQFIFYFFPPNQDQKKGMIFNIPSLFFVVALATQGIGSARAASKQETDAKSQISGGKTFGGKLHTLNRPQAKNLRDRGLQGGPTGCPADHVFVEFEFTTDSNPDETSWEIYGASWETHGYLLGGPYGDMAQQTFNQAKCFPADECLSLDLTDTGGDGMISGGFKLKMDGSMVVMGVGSPGLFQSSLSYSFNCDNNPDPSPSTPSPTESPTPSPTSSSDDCPEGEMLVKVEFTTSEVHELRWEMLDANGNVYLTVGPYEENDHLYTHNQCTPSDACLSLNIFESNGESVFKVYYEEEGWQYWRQGTIWGYHREYNFPVNCV